MKMTTIVYNHETKQIACDGLMTAGNEIKSTSFKKWHEKDGVYYFFAGDIADIKPFLDMDKLIGFKPDFVPAVTCIFVIDGVAYCSGVDNETGYFEIELTFNEAIGSGAPYALSVMKLGKSAFSAAEFAATMDVGTGGDISVFDVESMEFITGGDV